MDNTSRRRNHRRNTTVNEGIAAGVDAFHEFAAAVPRPCFAVLDEGGIARLKQAAFDLLADHGVAITHVLAPGKPVIAAPLMFTLDMRTGSAMQACVESRQAAAMAIQVMKQGFGLIVHTYGSGSDTPDVDLQSMAERAPLGEAVVLAGADILGGVGQLPCATVFSPVQAVFDNEPGAMLRRSLRVPAVHAESLNWAEIRINRPGRHFLDSRHTLKYCRDQFEPRTFLRDDRHSYEASGHRTAFEAARDLCLDLLCRPPPADLPDAGQADEMAQIVAPYPRRRGPR